MDQDEAQADGHAQKDQDRQVVPQQIIHDSAPSMRSPHVLSWADS
jgi:hypothetical protein